MFLGLYSGQNSEWFVYIAFPFHCYNANVGRAKPSDNGAVVASSGRNGKK